MHADGFAEGFTEKINSWVRIANVLVGRSIAQLHIQLSASTGAST
jgi:hypothetical protein